MEAYPEDYVAHNLPLIALSGLESTSDALDLLTLPPAGPLASDRGTGLATQLPPVAGEKAEQLLEEFAKADGTNAPWNSRSTKAGNPSFGFKLRAVGREFKLPARKADPPDPTSPTLSPPGTPTLERRPSYVLHSPISPLSPGSPIYPDGLMTPFWLSKHQYNVPSAFICFFGFTSDPNRNSLNDNQLKSEINRMKGLIGQSGYRTRFVAVLLSDKTILEAPDIEERLTVIKRATGLDPKNSLFFLPPNTSRVELSSFVSTLLTVLQPICVEYYRDLTKHTRRKKGRGHIPAPTLPPTRGTSQALSAPGWQVRYEFKLGVFAEFRQEMDAAGRHYAFAFDALLASDGPFETTPTWSPRWDEYRLLADIIALRLLRCQLWNNIPTTAVQSWSAYHERIQDVVNRRGKGSKNYGWAAWESRWARVMAETIQKAELPVFAIALPVKNTELAEETPNALFSLPEKAIPVGERLPPWQYLHHPGYWYQLSAKYARRRRKLAEDMPEEDCAPPGQSPAAAVSHRYNTYDTYLCPEPHIEAPLPGFGDGFDHTNDILDPLNRAISEFYARDQQRWVDRLQLDTGEELIRAGRWSEALSVLKPLWEGMHWRKEGWWACVREVCEATWQCAVKARDSEMVIATQWELLSSLLHAAKSGQKRNFMLCLDDVEEQGVSPGDMPPKVAVGIRAENMTPFLSTTFVFGNTEAHVGEPLQAQIAISSQAHASSAPLVLSGVSVKCGGSLDLIDITHKPSDGYAIQTPTLIPVTLEESSASSSAKLSFQGSADLTIHPNQRKVLTFPLFLREAGDVTVRGNQLFVTTPRFELTYSTVLEPEQRSTYWWIAGPNSSLLPKRLTPENATSLKVLPKPPKVEVRVLDSRENYYTDEPVTVDIEVTNGEEEETAIVLEVRFFSRSGEVLRYHWNTPEEVADEKRRQSTDSTVDLPGHSIGNLTAGGKHVETITFTGTPLASEHVLEVKALYHLVSDLETPLSKIVAKDVVFLSPFEANYELSPRVHPEAWPNMFTLPNGDTEPNGTEKSEGLKQRWNLTANIVSFAEENLVIEKMQLLTQHATACSIIRIQETDSEPSEDTIKPREACDRTFDIDIQKPSLDDRRPCALEMDLSITWRRTSSPDKLSITTHLPIPRLTTSNLEPRVILSSTPATKEAPYTILNYTIENPTLHFLAFEIGMEATEAFAFGGPKLRVINLLPLTRQDIEFRVVPLAAGVGKDGGWLYPSVRVTDRYFGKVLKVLAGKGVKDFGGKEERGCGVWVEGS